MSEAGSHDSLRRPSLFQPPALDTGSSHLEPLLPSVSQDHIDTVSEWSIAIRDDNVRLVRSLITESVAVPVKMSHILRSTQDSEHIKRIVKDKMGRAGVYIMLLVCKEFRAEAEEDRVNKALLESRALYAEVLSILLVAEHDRLDALTEVLTYQWDDMNSIYDPIQNALTVAVDARAVHFVSDARVQETMIAVWRGNYVLNTRMARGLERQFGRARAREIIHRREELQHSKRSFSLKWWKIKIPRYQYYTSVVIYFAYVALYSYCVVRRTEVPGTAEIVMYIMSLSFIAEDTKSVLMAHKRFEALGLWNWADYFGYILFLVAFGFRMWALLLPTGDPDIVRYVDTSFNVLSCAAVLIWFRTLELLDTFRACAYLLITMRRCLSSSFPFFALIGVVIMGFTQAMYGLAVGPYGGHTEIPADRPTVPDIAPIVNMLFKGLLMDPEYDAASEIHVVYGTVLFHLFLFISSVLFVNLLIAAFCNSFEGVLIESDHEVALLFAERTLSHIQRSHEVPFLPPANLLELLCLPLQMLIGGKRTRALLEYVCACVFIPELLMIGLYEYLFPPEVSSQLESLTKTNVAFETWRLDMECDDGAGGTLGVGLAGAKRRAAEPERRILHQNASGSSAKNVGNSAAIDRLLEIVQRLETKVDHLEAELRATPSVHRAPNSLL
ncbi:hypothetical protein BDZ88DRAFT_418408 [Geranomyces variabilis]|nr:hypothetical protein BDZ88DRAFT_418408 [Geranomyces variabilis]KAJ3133304.1 hypothetical protein HDU90_006252 [Geranomyces variabilis]